MGSGYNKSCVGINGGVYYVIPWFDRFEGLVVCAVSGGEHQIKEKKKVASRWYLYHQAFKPIEPWKNNIVHTAIDSYTGFIYPEPMTNTSGCCYSL